MHKMRRIAQHMASFAQRIEHEGNVQLLKISNPAMHQLRASAGSTLGEIETLNEQCPVSPGSRLHRRAKPSSSSADDKNIPRLCLFSQVA